MKKSPDICDEYTCDPLGEKGESEYIFCPFKLFFEDISWEKKVETLGASEVVVCSDESHETDNSVNESNFCN